MPTLMDLLDAGVHFGHKKERSHPRMKDYTFSLREGVFIIDLDQTKDYLEKALNFLKQEVSNGKTILFVGTKRQAKEAVKQTAEQSGMPYVVQRWLGGTLTNYETIRKSIDEMERLEVQIKSPEFNSFTKKERKLINDRLEKLESIFGGVKDMKKLPDVIFAVDAHRESLAIEEATKMGIPVVALADTDSNPTKINYIIPSNDDAVKAIELIMGEVRAAIGIKKTEVKKAESKKEETKTEKSEEMENKGGR